ncbi:MAG: aspartate-semialdehyde dehydrogenase [Calditrichaceae bacterium]|nr:aspartate-semialdehyde dehydrogenase [Calditrichia bacterium]NUQ42791.1 aspartate-semialdehyde dehydrogenase [Calditrichaceae bacterium]
MNPYTVAVVGATGLVGQKMIEVLEERRFPLRKLVPVASSRSAGKTVKFNDQPVTVEALAPEVFRGVDFALFSAGAAVSREFAPVAAELGAIVIDNSSAWRMDPQVPLVVPEVNPQALQAHRGIIANPNCSTIQMVVALHPLHRRFGIRRIVVSTYQSVSGTGQKAVRQLEEEIAAGKSPLAAYPHPIAYNCLPHIDVFFEDGYTREEHKMVQETRKIMGDPDLQISATCVRVPVLGGHSESINLQFREPFEIEEVRALLRAAPGVVVQDHPGENVYPMPIHSRNRDEVFVGRIRRDPSIENGLNLWVVSDNLRKGAATNAVQIAEMLTTGR